MTEEKRTIFRQMAFRSGITDGQAKHHAVNIAEIGVKGAFSSGKYRLGRIGERLMIALAVEPLMPRLGMPVLLDVDIPTMDTADLIVREAVLDEELLQGLRINDFGEFCRKPEQAKNGRLVLCGQRIEHLHYYADF